MKEPIKTFFGAIFFMGLGLVFPPLFIVGALALLGSLIQFVIALIVYIHRHSQNK